MKQLQKKKSQCYQRSYEMNCQMSKQDKKMNYAAETI